MQLATTVISLLTLAANVYLIFYIRKMDRE